MAQRIGPERSHQNVVPCSTVNTAVLTVRADIAAVWAIPAAIPRELFMAVRAEEI